MRRATPRVAPSPAARDAPSPRHDRRTIHPGGLPPSRRRRGPGLSAPGGAGHVVIRPRCSRQAVRGEAVSISDDAVVIRKAYEGCEALTRDASKTFYFATLLMRERQRRSVWAIYGWCRTLDETVDAVEVAEAGSGVAEGKLRAIESQLRRMFSSSDASSSSSSSSSASLDAQLASSPETIALADTIRNTPGMSAEPFLDMIVGMRSDLSVEAPEEAPDAQPATRPSEAAASSPASRPYFRDWPELRRYCYNVAGTVGLMTLPVMGVAPGYEVADATPAGIDLGIALQLTNIIRDVGEDARRGRLYLPLDAVAAAGLTPEEVMDPTGVVVGDERYAALIEGEIRRAEEHFERARAGVPMLAPAARLPVLDVRETLVPAAAEIYGEILNKLSLSSEVRENGYDNITRRAYTTTGEKLAKLPGLAWRAWFA